MFAESAFALKDFVAGYIVNLEGDKIRGMIEDQDPDTFVQLYVKIRFVQEGQRRVKKYTASDISAYGYEGMDLRSVRLRNESMLLKTSYYTDDSAPFVFLKVISSNDYLVFIGKNLFLMIVILSIHVSGLNQMVLAKQGVFELKKKRLTECFSKCKVLVDAIEKEIIATVIEVFDFYSKKCATDE